MRAIRVSTLRSPVSWKVFIIPSLILCSLLCVLLLKMLVFYVAILAQYAHCNPYLSLSLFLLISFTHGTYILRAYLNRIIFNWTPLTDLRYAVCKAEDALFAISMVCYALCMYVAELFSTVSSNTVRFYAKMTAL